MTDRYEVLVRNAHLRHHHHGTVDIGISAGRIAAIAPHLDLTAQTVIDAGGGLVTESFVNPHLHLCKVYSLDLLDDEALIAYHGEGMGQAMTAIELAAQVKERLTCESMLKNLRRAVAEAALYGCTHIRAFADVDSKAGLEGVRALLLGKEAFKGIVDLQVVAFAQDGIVREPAAAELMRAAISMGADVVGGIPWIEYTEADMDAHIRFIFDLAEEFDRPVSMLVDDAGDPGLRTLEKMAVETIRRNRQGRSLAHHARAMSLYHRPYLEKVIALMKKAQMGLVSDPHTGPLHARVKELLHEGVLVCLGQDDISDAYYPFGRNNMLEVGFICAHLLWMTTRQDIQVLYDMITTRAAQAIGLEQFALAVGNPANLVVLDAPNELEAFRYHAAPRCVISHGQVVDNRKIAAMRQYDKLQID
ncbi:MAG: amidohydrolase family protein [Anaerolineaceae bacterium]|jgi:cytosine deaminase